MLSLVNNNYLLVFRNWLTIFACLASIILYNSLQKLCEDYMLNDY
jgi:hypothetical protein